LLKKFAAKKNFQIEKFAAVAKILIVPAPWGLAGSIAMAAQGAA